MSWRDMMRAPDPYTHKSHKAQKPPAAPISADSAISAYSVAEAEALRTAAGPDWGAIKDNPDALDALRLALDVERSRTEGIAPPDYTQPAHCGGCGPVLLWFGAPTRVMACVWCDNRINGRPIPRPAAPPPAPIVTCETCQHYIANEHGAGGLGRCGIDAPGSRTPPALWPRGEHRCAAWRADNHG